MTDIKKLRELMEKAHGYGLGFYQKEKLNLVLESDDAELVLELVAQAPSLLSELEALREFVEEVRGMDETQSEKVIQNNLDNPLALNLEWSNLVWRSLRDAALARLDERLK